MKGIAVIYSFTVKYFKWQIGNMENQDRMNFLIRKDKKFAGRES